jgi:predicted TPR repeat methyltransferase
MQAVRERLRSENNLRYVLEPGCGTGLFTEDLPQRASKVTATDFSDEMIVKATGLRQALLNVSFFKDSHSNINKAFLLKAAGF